MSSQPETGEIAVLVHVNFGHSTYQEELDEFHELAVAAGAQPAAVITTTRIAPDAKFFVGTGKAEEIKAAVKALNAPLVLINHTLTPGQERNLERLIGCRVLDRIGLILDIFAQRARTFEGKLQVELAQLQHLSSRLIRGWTHLERQKGGIGLRGPGETQLESDRRAIKIRIKVLKERLEKVRSQRQQGRQARQKAALPTVSVVGYTNAGKSTLFNHLTHADVYAANQLFATLDPTLRRISLPDFGEAIMADTVGFIRHLPHDLIDAFRATLEETQEADLLLHVVDTSGKELHSHINEVETVLQQIGANTLPQIQVFNKIDLTGVSPHTERDADGHVCKVWLSAATGAGMELLTAALSERLNGDIITTEVTLPPSDTKLRAALYNKGTILTEKIDEEGNYRLAIRMPKGEYERLFVKST